MADPKLLGHIQTSRSQGKSKEEIYKELLHQGWTVDAIQEGFLSLGARAAAEDTQKRTIWIFVLIGAILVGAGIFSFIAANWEKMARPTKVSIIVAAMLAAYAAGWHARENLHLKKTGEALILLGSIIYGAGIFLVAQMFHARADWPDGFILWTMGTIAMAHAAESFSLFYLAIPLGATALMGYPSSIFTHLRFDRFLLTSSLLLLAATAVTFISGWAVRKKIPPGPGRFL